MGRMLFGLTRFWQECLRADEGDKGCGGVAATRRATEASSSSRWPALSEGVKRVRDGIVRRRINSQRRLSHTKGSSIGRGFGHAVSEGPADVVIDGPR